MFIKVFKLHYFSDKMECFIKKIWQGKGEEAHDCFVRFGRGQFKNRAVLVLQRTSKIKLKGNFEWANDFVQFVSELADTKFSGIILSKDKLDLENEKKKARIFQYDVSINSEKVQELKDKVYCMLLDAEAEGITLKMKKKLPGKGDKAKVDDRFCQLEIDLRFWPQVKEAFMLPECKKCKISHIYNIGEVIMPEGEKDFVKIRELARKKGKIIRKMEIDGQESEEEKDFEA